jgi:HAD superfamily hydrolase (TIGR01549 family)
MKSCIIFDLDKTLIESREVNNSIAKLIYNEFGVDTRKLDSEKIWSYTVEQFARELAKQTDKVSNKQIRDFYIEKACVLYKKVKIRAIDFLIECHLSGNKVCVVTNNSKKIVYSLLESRYNKIDFDMILGFEDLKKNESKVENILRVKKKYGDNYKYYYVGDHLNDIKYAKKANVVSVGITSGVFSFKNLRAEKPDFIIKNIKELEKIL